MVSKDISLHFNPDHPKKGLLLVMGMFSSSNQHEERIGLNLGDSSSDPLLLVFRVLAETSSSCDERNIRV